MVPQWTFFQKKWTECSVHLYSSPCPTPLPTHTQWGWVYFWSSILIFIDLSFHEIFLCHLEVLLSIWKITFLHGEGGGLEKTIRKRDPCLLDRWEYQKESLLLPHLFEFQEIIWLAVHVRKGNNFSFANYIGSNSRVFLLRQIWIINYYVKKSHQKFSKRKQKNWCFQTNSLFWHINSRFVLKTTETPVFLFSLMRFFD